MSRFAIIVEGSCRGFVLRSRHQYQAYTADEKSLGIYDTEDGAVAALFPDITNKST